MPMTPDHKAKLDKTAENFEILRDQLDYYNDAVTEIMKAERPGTLNRAELDDVTRYIEHIDLLVCDVMDKLTTVRDRSRSKEDRQAEKAADEQAEREAYAFDRAVAAANAETGNVVRFDRFPRY